MTLVDKPGLTFIRLSHCLLCILTAETRKFWIFPWAAVSYDPHRYKARINAMATSLLSQYWKWKSINNHASISVAHGGRGSIFLFVLTLLWEEAPEREGRRRAVGSAAICYFTFQIIYCDRANLLLQSAKQYAQPWLTVSPAKCQDVTERFIAGHGEKVASPFFRECISHAMICVLTLINHSLQHYSPWRLTLRDSLFPMRTHPHKHTTLGDELGSNSVQILLETVKCHVGEWKFRGFFLLISMLTDDVCCRKDRKPYPFYARAFTNINMHTGTNTNTQHICLEHFRNTVSLSVRETKWASMLASQFKLHLNWMKP